MKVEIGGLMTKLSISGFDNTITVPLSSSLKKKIFTYYQSFDTVLKHFRIIIFYNSRSFYLVSETDQVNKFLLLEY